MTGGRRLAALRAPRAASRWSDAGEWPWLLWLLWRGDGYGGGEALLVVGTDGVNRRGDRGNEGERVEGGMRELASNDCLVDFYGVVVVM